MRPASLLGASISSISYLAGVEFPVEHVAHRRRLIGFAVAFVVVGVVGALLLS